MRGDLPMADAIDLAARYGQTRARAPASKPFAGEANVGDQRSFFIIEVSAGTLAQASPPRAIPITATLRAKSQHAYFYEDEALDVSAADVQKAADKFEATVWPDVTAAFGEPPIPGVDGDPRIIVLQADLGGALGGYFSQDDEYLRAVHPLSNEAEIVYLDRTLKPGDDVFNVVLAHEFQHLVHWQDDRDEEAWVNEGLAEDASGLVGGAVSSINAFEAKPATQLNAWDSQGSAAHYGASAAFFRYLASRFGGDPAFGKIASEQRDGAAGVDDFLASLGERERFRDVFADWIAANVLNQPSGPYANPARPLHMAIDRHLTTGQSKSGAASQFGTDYYRLDIEGGEYVLRFDGKSDVPVLPTHPPGGDRATLWSNAEDGVDTRLTREIDLTAAAAPVLSFKTWYDIERWFDWGYVSASTDGGKTWEALTGDQTTTDDPAKVAYGPGYTGTSGGADTPQWVDERVRLAKYAGKKILLRFESVTDDSTHGEGWVIADIAVSGTIFHDPDGSDSGWRSEGWVRIDRPLKQTYVVRLIEERAGGDSAVVEVPLDASEHGELRFHADGVQSATLAIAGSTEGTNQQAPYTVELARP